MTTERNRSQCSAIRADGSPCRARPMAGRDTCLAHTPELASERREWRARGGEHSSALARAGRALDCLPADYRRIGATLAQAIAQVHSGDLDPARALAIASLTRAMLTWFDGALKLYELAKAENDALKGERIDAIVSGSWP